MSIGNISLSATPNIRVAIYCRFSSTMQRGQASLEDQERNCRKYATDQGWVVQDEYVRSDSAKSGKQLVGREALKSLVADARLKPRPYDIVVMDESSRMARNQEDVLRTVKILKFLGVKVVFLKQQLDSDNPHFPMLLNFHALMDEESSDQMRHRVLRGQEGRTRRGFTTGSRCFGYRSKLVPDPAKPDAQSRVDMLGTKWVVVPSEAATINRIYQLYADGLSDYQIMLKFNQERVPAARKPRIGPDQTFWNTALIKRILRNEKYIGKRIWNKTSQVSDPETGKTVTRRNPPERWVHTDVPDLRIVPDELWNRVQERLKIVNEKMTACRIGGINRAKKKDYLFSGLLTCGLCGSRMTIGCSRSDHRYAAYSCVSWRYKRGCTNNLWIKESRLSEQLVAEMANNMLVPNVMEYFIGGVSLELEQYLKGIAGNRDGSMEDLKAREAILDRTISSLVEAIASPTTAHSPALLEKLATVEGEREQVRNAIRVLTTPQTLAEAKLDIGAIVRANVENLLEIIKQDVPKAREVLQRHINKLVLYPTVTDNGPGYEVLGEIDLFKSSSGRKNRILLDCSSTGTVQQYAGHVDFGFRFFGLVLYAQVDSEPNPLLEPLSKLLASNPDLLHEPRFAMTWAKLIKSVVSPESELHQRVNDNYVAWNFRNRAKIFGEQLGMTTIVHNRMTWYMFSKSPVTCNPAENAQAA